MNFVDPEDEAPVMSFVPVATCEPQVIRFKNSAGTFFWSEIERSVVPPSGDVTFYNSPASVARVMADLQQRFPTEFPQFEVVGATEVDTARGVGRSVSPSLAPAVASPDPDEDDKDEDYDDTDSTVAAPVVKPPAEPVISAFDDFDEF